MAAMRVGRNGSATEFFSRHGGGAMLTDSDTKRKYTSRVAELYKEELAKRVKEDANRCVLHLLNYRSPLILSLGSRTESILRVWLRPLRLLRRLPRM